MIANADQGGLGLPDRDYYLKDDPKSVKLREQYLAHVQKMLELLGESPAQSRRGRTNRAAHRNGFGERIA
jgi:putative endopeptidase